MRKRLRVLWDAITASCGHHAKPDLTTEVVSAYMELLREQRRLQFDGQPIVNRIIYTTNRTGDLLDPFLVPDTFPEEWVES